MSAKSVIKSYRPPFLGVDLKTDDINRNHPFCSGGKNVRLGDAGEIATRYGTQIKINGYGVYGSAIYDGVDLLGTAKKELILFGRKYTVASTNSGEYHIFVVKESSFTITNNHATDTATVRHFYDTTTSDFRFKITVGTTVELNYDLGIGTEASPITLAQLETAVDGSVSCTMSTPTYGTNPAAFCQLIDDETIAAGASKTFYYMYIFTVFGFGDTNYTQLSNFKRKMGSNDFHNVSTCLLNSVLYISPSEQVSKVYPFSSTTILPVLCKYDGQTYFRAGLPKSAAPSGGTYTATGTSVTDVKGTFARGTANPGVYLYKQTYIQRDKTGLIIEGNISDVSVAAYTVPAGNFHQLVLDRLSQVGTGGIGYNVGFAKAAGDQNSNTINVDDGTAIANFAFTVAVNDVIDKGAAHGLTAPKAVYFTTTGTLPTGLSPNQRYFIWTVTANTFKVSLNPNATDPVSITAGTGAGVHTCYSSIHWMREGDIAYFWDNGKSKFIERRVTSQNVTSITLSNEQITFGDTGSAPNVKDNCVFSNNLRIALWRTLDGGTDDFFLVGEFPHDPSDPTNNVVDDVTDANLGAEYIETPYSRDPPPKCKQVSKFNDKLIMFGDDLNKNTVYFSDELPEYFPAGTHSFDITGTGVTSAGDCGDTLAIFNNNETFILAGDLANFQFRVDKISSSIGCVSHETFKSLEEGVAFFLSEKGPYSITNGRVLAPLGAVQLSGGQLSSRLEPFFIERYERTAIQPVFKRSTACIMPKSNLYVLFVPFENPEIPSFATSESVIWVYDYARGSWWPKWTGINAQSGVLEKDDLLYFISRSHDGTKFATYLEAVASMSEQQKDAGEWIYADHNAYIDFQYKTHWESLGNPSIFKKFIRAKIVSALSRVTSTMRFYVKTYFDFSETTVRTNVETTFTTDKDKSVKLLNDKALSHEISIESIRYHEPVVLTGIDVEVSTPFRKMK